MTRLLDRMEELWCRYMHDHAMWPINGRYLCGVCLREYPVQFEGPEPHSHAGETVFPLLSDVKCAEEARA